MLDYDHIAAVAAVIRTGTFDKAAQQLHVTPSAVSQRVKALEERLGTVLIVRGQPCTGTAAGDLLSRHAEKVSLLETEFWQGFGAPTAAPVTLRIAVNADSLATWFVHAMAAVDGILFDIVVDDQDHSADWLRRGAVLAAVTASAAPVQGCGIRALGALRYLATASPAFAGKHFVGGVTAETLIQAPAMRFDAKDELQSKWMESAIGRSVVVPSHWVPSTHAFLDGALAGLGWGMNPEPLARPHVAAGRLVELIPARPLDIPLYWQWSKIVEPAIAPVTAAILAAARRHLVAP